MESKQFQDDSSDLKQLVLEYESAMNIICNALSVTIESQSSIPLVEIMKGIAQLQGEKKKIQRMLDDERWGLWRQSLIYKKYSNRNRMERD